MATTRTANLSNCCAATHFTVTTQWPDVRSYDQCNACGNPCTVITWKLTPVVDPIPALPMAVVHHPAKLREELEAARKKLMDLTLEQLHQLLHRTMHSNEGVADAKPWIDLIEAEIEQRAQLRKALDKGRPAALEFLKAYFNQPSPLDGAPTPSEGTHPAGSDNN